MAGIAAVTMEAIAGFGVFVLFIGFYGVTKALDNLNRHQSNIANRLLDIEQAIKKAAPR